MPTKPVEIARLELVGVVGEKPDVGDSEVGPTGAEGVPEREGGQGGVTAGTAPGDDEPVAVDLSFGGQISGGGETILDICDTP